jgi:phosphoglycolate phosphatase-like HAD superfamily hydrolase
LLIFDLDGVITSEDAYWDAAGLTLHELQYSPHYWNLNNTVRHYHPATNAHESRRISRSTFPESEILALKARSINSNWDTCYAAACLRLIDLLALLPDCSPLLPLQPWEDRWIADFREELESVWESGRVGDLSAVFADPIFNGGIGLELINRFDAFASKVLGHTIENVFSRHSPFWAFCRNIFQEWYLGDDFFTETYGHEPAQAGKPGCIHFEKPLLPIEKIHDTLETLHERGYVLGFATGRVWQEAAYPLNMYGLLEFFDQAHLSTYDDVERVEAELRTHGDLTLLSKPNPFPFLVAANRNAINTQTRPECFVVVGDSTSDILGGRAAGAITIAVMTGARTTEARALLARSNPDFTIADMTGLPELLKRLDGLATIQQMQFAEREKAERLLRYWFAWHMQLKTEGVTLTPKAVSLNSFNGFYRSDGEEYFFKTHIEEQGILEEYYHAEQLFEAGYNIVRPLRTIHQEGQQMVIYPVVRWPVMFDLMRAVETGAASDGTLDTLESAEKLECARLLDIYRSTCALSTAEEHARAPVHQLFWHRLTGRRYKNFYEGKVIPFPTGLQRAQPFGGVRGVPEKPFSSTLPPAASQRGRKKEEAVIPFYELLRYHWIINGVWQQRTLGELIERAKVVLNPARAALTIIGHGDAHFGNVFLENQSRYLYFDPAFAGRHSPLLDIIKPLFHNVFATWMYFPHDIAHDLTVTKQDTTIAVEHNYRLTPVREAILDTKVEHMLRPLIAELRARDELPADWKEIMQLAMLCCALLTINLLDGERMPPSITWLGLALALQIGNSGIQPWGYNI